MAGLATVNLAADPFSQFDGFWGACSTYGSFSYLKYGLMRLFSQLAQDSELKVGKVLWIAAHSRPETAEDSRTHFGIFSIGVTQLFPEGHVIDLHPWEYNEVPVMLGTAFGLDIQGVAVRLTRPPVEIPDQEALGIPSHLAAARGAYVLRDYVPGLARGGTVFVRGTMPTRNVVSLLPALADRGTRRSVHPSATSSASSLAAAVDRPPGRPPSAWISPRSNAWLHRDWFLQHKQVATHVPRRHVNRSPIIFFSAPFSASGGRPRGSAARSPPCRRMQRATPRGESCRLLKLVSMKYASTAAGPAAARS